MCFGEHGTTNNEKRNVYFDHVNCLMFIKKKKKNLLPYSFRERVLRFMITIIQLFIILQMFIIYNLNYI